jgi:5-methylcytosine-specific restriction endonuclease McrA
MHEYKTCTKCGQTKSVELFYKGNGYKGGYRPRCKSCFNQASKDKKSEYYLSNRPEILQKVSRYRSENVLEIASKRAKWRSLNSEKTSLYSYKRRAKFKENGTFLITAKEIDKLKSLNCFACGKSGQIQIDHIIPIARGGRHSIGNLLPLCSKCNLSKNKKTFMEWRIFKMKSKQ